MFAVAEHFKISPLDIWDNWDYPLFADAVERIHVLNEIEYRQTEEEKP